MRFGCMSHMSAALTPPPKKKLNSVMFFFQLVSIKTLHQTNEGKLPDEES